ncbi:MAG: glutamate--cysteine ligase [Gammaproteobacteria bacterium]|nr:glutamate--cysteine ligase [Gammaproteobacteria bacterium]MBU1656113.1 glutamate--cysteine ligase [Gammaproteobacteria bacterium]MBU1962198.1 glutamate--cysteine ligase [Gammaproteobacteria bacterium]
MGTEISQSHFEPADFAAFQRRLAEETALLGRWLREASLPVRPTQGGYELEAWLIDREGLPAPAIERLLPLLNDDHVVPELARFNIELNGNAFDLQGDALSRMYTEIGSAWTAARRAAQILDLDLLMIGMLPTVEQKDFNLGAMSPLQRYRALNEQVFQLRQDMPIQLDIEGRDHLRLSHQDVMLEAATTSFQIHLRTTGSDETVRLYNASKVVSGPLVALTANSPFLFGHDLWAESRIPVFEQAIVIGQSDLTKRVSFGIKYAEGSILEVFEANLNRYPILLPVIFDEPPEALAHLRLHNGTIWRWNRPLVGFDADGAPHLRIEHRVAPSGPTSLDLIANAAFYFGVTRALLEAEVPIETQIPFATACDNFYRCARDGLDARITWSGGTQAPVRELLRDLLLPQARSGLAALGIDRAEIGQWLGILDERLASGQNGATWQRHHHARNGGDLRAMTLAYREHQESGLPVHRWPT